MFVGIEPTGFDLQSFCQHFVHAAIDSPVEFGTGNVGSDFKDSEVPFASGLCPLFRIGTSGLQTYLQCPHDTCRIAPIDLRIIKPDRAASTLRPAIRGLHSQVAVGVFSAIPGRLPAGRPSPRKEPSHTIPILRPRLPYRAVRTVAEAVRAPALRIAHS